MTINTDYKVFFQQLNTKENPAAGTIYYANAEDGTICGKFN